MSLDEYLYGKFSTYLNKRRKSSLASRDQVVKLEDVKARLSIFARAITGESIDIYPAEREGGYKNTNFFLPAIYGELPIRKDNVSFYLFRVLYLSYQKNMQINWGNNDSHTLLESQEKAQEFSSPVLKILFDEFPPSEEIFHTIKSHYENKAKNNKSIDFTFLFGKLMKNDPNQEINERNNKISEKIKNAIKDEIITILKAKPVEEVVTLEIDSKQQEDYVLTHNFEKVDTAEEWDGGWRDMDGEDDMEDHAAALEELNMKYTVRVDDAVHSIYQADFIENTTISESTEISSTDYHIEYDEWDYKKRNYKEKFCKLYPRKETEKNVSYYNQTIRKNASILLGLRKMLTNVNNKMQQRRRQTQGEAFDIDAITDLFVDVHSGHTPSEKIYLSKRKQEKDLSILMLLDISLSSDGYAAGNKVIDVEKQVSILFGEILNEFNVDFAINCFYSKTRNHSSYLTVKDFDDEWNSAKYKIGAVQPEAYTRIGTAIRHAGSLLDRRDTKNKWLILISDGKPNDFDRYEGKYGINDVKQALRELNQRNINSYALAVEAQAKYYLPQMFGQNHYQILTTPVELLQSLVKLYEKIKHQN